MLKFKQTIIKKIYPWLANKCQFIRFGADLIFFNEEILKDSADNNKYIVCIGASKRDWDTLINAYRQIDIDIKLKIIGCISSQYERINGVEQVDHIPINELINQIHNSLFCVIPLKSYNYSYGQMTLLQQMALGKCAVTSLVSSLKII